MGDAAHHLVRFSDPEDLGGLRAGDGARESLDTEPQRPVVRTFDEVTLESRAPDHRRESRPSLRGG